MDGLKNKAFLPLQVCRLNQFYLHKCSHESVNLQNPECRWAKIFRSYLDYSIKKIIAPLADLYVRRKYRLYFKLPVRIRKLNHWVNQFDRSNIHKHGFHLVQNVSINLQL